MKVRWAGPPASFLNGRVGNSGPFLRGGSDLSLVSASLRFCFLALAYLALVLALAYGI